MCVQDLRIAKATEVSTKTVVSGNSVATDFLKPDPARIAIIIALANPDPAGTAADPEANATLYYGPANGGLAIASINAYNPTRVLDIRQYGNLIRGPLSLQTNGNGGSAIGVSTVRLIATLPSIESDRSA